MKEFDWHIRIVISNWIAYVIDLETFLMWFCENDGRTVRAPRTKRKENEIEYKTANKINTKYSCKVGCALPLPTPGRLRRRRCCYFVCVFFCVSSAQNVRNATSYQCLSRIYIFHIEFSTRHYILLGRCIDYRRSYIYSDIFFSLLFLFCFFIYFPFILCQNQRRSCVSVWACVALERHMTFLCLGLRRPPPP